MIKKKSYISTFTNKYGEAWYFEYDSVTGTGILKGSDVDWQPYRIINGRASGLLLSDEELIWLRKAWVDATAE